MHGTYTSAEVAAAATPRRHAALTHDARRGLLMRLAFAAPEEHGRAIARMAIAGDQRALAGAMRALSMSSAPGEEDIDRDVDLGQALGVATHCIPVAPFGWWDACREAALAMSCLCPPAAPALFVSGVTALADCLGSPMLGQCGRPTASTPASRGACGTVPDWACWAVDGALVWARWPVLADLEPPFGTPELTLCVRCARWLAELDVASAARRGDHPSLPSSPAR